MEIEILPLLEFAVVGIIGIMALLIILYFYLSVHKKNENAYTEEEE